MRIGVLERSMFPWDAKDTGHWSILDRFRKTCLDRTLLWDLGLEWEGGRYLFAYNGNACGAFQDAFRNYRYRVLLVCSGRRVRSCVYRALFIHCKICNCKKK